MAVKIIDREIHLAVRDILQPEENNLYIYHSFPLPKRGIMGQDFQKHIQQKYQQKGYQIFREYAIGYATQLENYSIHIRGKIDGVYKKTKIWKIEEIKSVVMEPKIFRVLSLADVGSFSEQVLFYCLFLHKIQPYLILKPVLTLGNLTSQQIRRFAPKFDPPATERLLFERLKLIVSKVELRDNRTLKRRKILHTFHYPFGEKRIQQHKIIDEVTTATENQEHLLISAPTGIGKTAAVIYPALKFALVHGKKVFFATSKNTQQRIVLETVTAFKQKKLDLSAVFLRAADKMCLNHVYFCHEDYCPYVKDLRQRYRDSGLAQILQEEEISDPDRVLQLARQYFLCPSEILIEQSKSADFIVGDYNYIFDPSGSMHHIFMGENFSEWILIIDEAHNLYQRGLDYLSMKLSRKDVKNILRYTTQSKNKVFAELKKSLSALKKIMDHFHEEGRSAYSGHSYYVVDPDVERVQSIYADFESAYIQYLIEKIKRRSLFPEDPIEDFYFEFRRFISVLSHIDDRSQILFRADNGGKLQVQCCDPSVYLNQIIDKFHSTIAMSATIEPVNFYRSALGFGTSRTRTISLDSPFMNKNRKIIVVPEPSTRYKHRTAYYPHYAEIIKRTIRKKKGNYIVFFPSFEFLQGVNLFLGEMGSEKLIQRKKLTEEDRSEILESFCQTDHPHLLLAVLGGIFSESVDLKGDNCIGVIIFSPAFPKITLENEIIRFFHDQNTGNGFEQAYIIPGMNKVIQAAGRLIRSNQDHGVILIVGERFSEDSINQLFPEHWFKNPGDVIFTPNFEKALKDFWESHPD